MFKFAINGGLLMKNFKCGTPERKSSFKFISSEITVIHTSKEKRYSGVNYLKMFKTTLLTSMVYHSANAIDL